MKRKTAILLAIASILTLNVAAVARDPLSFEGQSPKILFLTMPWGEEVTYYAYEGIYYVTNVADSTYQTLNYYVPAEKRGTEFAPILMRNYVGGYMAAEARRPSATDATGRALYEGYCVCIAGARGRDSEQGGAFTGRAPAAILDLKAAVAYLHYNDHLMPGDANRIITDGTSAGGAMSALLGMTGNHTLYRPLLKAMGAADSRDDVFASACYCPIIDLEHADAAYEWTYQCVDQATRGASDEQMAIAAELAAQFPQYINELDIHDGEKQLTALNYRDYLKSFIIASAQRARNEGVIIPDSLGFTFYAATERRGASADGTRPSRLKRMPRIAHADRQSEFVTDVDLDTYLRYVATRTPLKSTPAFDAVGVAGAMPTGENELFGDATGSAVNFTAFSAAKSGQGTVTPEVEANVKLMNPMAFFQYDTAQHRIARFWYIRHGAADRDTAFPVPINFATKLSNYGLNVDFAITWNRGHEGDYNLDDLFTWIALITRP